MKNISLLTFLILMTSCNLKSPNERNISSNLSKNQVEINILQSAGDQFDSKNLFLPLPFNVGTVDSENKRTILISKKIKKNKKTVGKVIAKILFKHDTLNNMLVCLPVEKTLEVISSENFIDLSTIDFQTKAIIESYLRAYKGVENDDFYKWQPID